MAGSAGMSTPTTALLCPTIVGRERELAVLDAALAGRARAAAVGPFFLVGEAGIGKSRLAREVGTSAEALRRCRCLRGRAVGSASPAPYRPLAEALCTAVRTAGPARTSRPRAVPGRPRSTRTGVAGRGRDRRRRVRRSCSARPCCGSCASSPPIAGVSSCSKTCTGPIPRRSSSPSTSSTTSPQNRSCCVATLRPEEDSPALALARRLDARRAGAVVELHGSTTRRSSGWWRRAST